MYNVSFGRFSGYTYEDMENDLRIFSRIFPGCFHMDTLGKTEDGRNLYHFVVGRREAKEKLFFFGGIHGREYMTSQLLMEQAAEFLTLFGKNAKTYKGISYGRLLEGKAVHVVPMANPDGVSISQMGEKGLRKEGTRLLVRQIAGREGGRMPCGYYYARWKANARGVDLNRNFDACWEEFQDGKGGPSGEGYKGEAPESEKESKALAKLTREEAFQRTVSYHSSGSVIYWNFGQEGGLREKTRRFGERVARITGYALEDSFDALAPAGYKDWAISKRGIPSLTVEIGRQESPLLGTCFREILRENRGVWEECLLELEEGEM